MKRMLRRHPIAFFFILACLFSWAVMVPLALARRGRIAPLPGWVHYLSAYGPLLAAFVVTAATAGRAGVNAWGRGLTRWRAGRLPWILALSPALLYVVAGVAQKMSRGAWPDPAELGRIAFLPDLGFWVVLVWILGSGVGEEAGWRGFALPALQRRHSPRVSSLVIAGGWMVWHVPAFFYLPSYERFGPGVAAGFFLGLLSGSFLLTWLANAAGGSTLLPAVWHGLFNLVTAPPSSAACVAPVVSTFVLVLGFAAVLRLRKPDAPWPTTSRPSGASAS